MALLGDHDTSDTGTGSDPASKKTEKHKQTVMVIAAIVGVLLTYLLYKRSQANAASATDTGTTTSTTAPSDGSDDSTEPDYTDLLQQLGSQLGSLTSSEQTDASNIAALQAAGVVTAPPATTTTTTTSGGVTSRSNIIPGGFNQKIPIRQFAADLLPKASQGNPNAVEAELEKLIAANPSLAHATYVTGGHEYTPIPTSIQNETVQQVRSTAKKTAS